MDPIAIGSFAVQILRLLPAVQQGVSGIIETVQWGTDAVDKMVEEKRDPTPEEWDELNARTDALRELLHSDEK